MRDEVRTFKRERVLEEAKRLFHERGFTGTSIDAIAESLKVTKPFIYTYFDSKQALLEEIHERAMRALLEGLDSVLADERPPPEQLRRLVEWYVRFTIENREDTATMMNEGRYLSADILERMRKQHRRFDRALTDLIKVGREHGVFDVEDPEMAAFAIIGGIRWMHRWYKPEGRLTINQLCCDMAILALNTVRASPGSGG